jgi:hypothetical protein
MSYLYLILILKLKPMLFSFLSLGVSDKQA